MDVHTDEGRTLRLLGNPLKMSATPVRFDRAPPHVDQDREDVLALLGALEKKRQGEEGE